MPVLRGHVLEGPQQLVLAGLDGEDLDEPVGRLLGVFQDAHDALGDAF